MELEQLSKNTLQEILISIDKTAKHSQIRKIVEEAKTEQEIFDKLKKLAKDSTYVRALKTEVIETKNGPRHITTPIYVDKKRLGHLLGRNKKQIRSFINGR